LVGIALVICAVGIGVTMILEPDYANEGFLLVAIFLLICSYAFITQASSVWSTYDYTIVSAGGRFFFVKNNQKRQQELFEIQIAAVSTMHFSIGRPKRRPIGEWRLNAPLAFFERGLLVSFTVLGQPRQHLVRMPGLTRRMALGFEQDLRQWLKEQEIAIPVEGFKRVPIDEDRLEMA